MDKFNEWLQIKGYSKKSIASIVTAVQYFTKWCEQENINDITEVSHNDVMAYIRYQNIRGVCKKTVAHYVMHTEKYFSFLQSENEVIDNPCSNIKIKGIKRKVLHDILSGEELENLYSNYSTEIKTNESHLNKLSRKRNKIMLGLVVCQAVRSEEILQMTLSDVKLREGKIYIAGARRSNERTLKLESHQLYDMLDYINDTRKQILQNRNVATPEQGLFMTMNKGAHLKNALGLLMQQLRKINPKVKSLDQLRASVIVHWLKQYNLRKVQIMAGHRYVSSTESYKANNMEELKEDIKNYHPF